MNYLERSAILTELIARLRAEDGWAGATHIQKSAYLLQEMLGVPLGLPFRLYKYGPYSNAVRDGLEEMEADGFIAVEPQPPPYGPRLQKTREGDVATGIFAEEIARYDPQLSFITTHLAPLGISELEKLTTAFFVTRETRSSDVSERAARLHEIKPHVSIDDATTAVTEIDDLLVQAHRA